MDERVKLAKDSLEYYTKNNKKMEVPDYVSDTLLNTKAGCFVTIYKNEELRGCVGTIEPTKESLAEEIIDNSISASIRDTRFPDINKNELDDLTYSVDVLTKPEEIESLEELDVEKYGVIVTSGFRRGLLLPNLDGIDSVEMQISIALQKAGINPEESYSMDRFEVIRYV